ncbi:secreted RxLR effector protein 161-like [Trifolium pratense]|uniref:secreted RxLR effector protein 161-like n=1 Tax=Trifolium pratense TaxID=57577 RepID=UPI001E692E97|nr:secreted RxLR effector protein 161-like [Trifolium pratense]
MKDLGKTKFCLGLQIEYTKNGILVHQSNYTERVLKRFNMDKANPLSTPMMGRTLNVEKDLFRPKEENETDLGSEVPYLSAIGALMYLANCTRPDIAFAVNLLARFSSYAGYLSDPHNAKSQTGYVFTYGDTAISWRSQKQTLVATSSNHAEVIALHEASKECRWLRSVTQHIQGTSGLPTDKNPTILYEDNAACVT